MALHLGQRGRACRHQLAHERIEALAPVESPIAMRPGNAPQVVHDIAACDDEDASIAQRRQPGPEIEVAVDRRAGMDGARPRQRCPRSRQAWV
jgi:hypothetical protein